MFAVRLETPYDDVAAIGVYFEQELTAQYDPGNCAAVGDRQRHPPHYARPIAISIDEENQIEAAGERADVLNIGADRTGNAHLASARSEADEAAQRNRIE